MTLNLEDPHQVAEELRAILPKGYEIRVKVLPWSKVTQSMFSAYVPPFYWSLLIYKKEWLGRRRIGALGYGGGKLTVDFEEPIKAILTFIKAFNE